MNLDGRLKSLYSFLIYEENRIFSEVEGYVQCRFFLFLLLSLLYQLGFSKLLRIIKLQE